MTSQQPSLNGFRKQPEGARAPPAGQTAEQQVHLCRLVGQTGPFQVQNLQGSARRHSHRQHTRDLVTCKRAQEHLEAGKEPEEGARASSRGCEAATKQVPSGL